jgi:hypothetical protein
LAASLCLPTDNDELLQNRVVARLGPRGEGCVEAPAAKAGTFGNGDRGPGPGDVAVDEVQFAPDLLFGNPLASPPASC